MADEQHEGDWAFGIDNGNAAVIEPEPDEIEPVHLHPFTAGLFNGDWGLEFWNLPDPDLKSVRVEFTSAPTGLVLFHGGTLVLGSDGTSTGPGYFDMAWPDPGIHHAHIDAYATALGEYGVTFKLVNAIANDGQNTALGDSGEYSVSFHAVPEPSSLLALLTPMAAFVVRRRR
jgi:hypothetical protein